MYNLKIERYWVAFGGGDTEQDVEYGPEWKVFTARYGLIPDIKQIMFSL